MATLIKSVKLSKKQLVVGESVRVQVQVTDPAADVMIDGIYGPIQFLQFRLPGTYTIVITVLLGAQVEQVGERIKVRIQSADVAKLPIIWATQDRYQPRTIAFSIANANTDLPEVRTYEWSFGDGTYGASHDSSVSHDYTNGLARDQLYSTFDVQVDARDASGTVTTGKRTISVFNTYYFNKIRRNVLTPRVTVQNPEMTPRLFVIVGEVTGTFTITNLEDEDIRFTEEKHEWLIADPADNPANNVEADVALPSDAHSISSASQSVLEAAEQSAGSPTPVDIVVPARSTTTVVRSFSKDTFAGTVFGVAVHLRGAGACSKLPAIASAYIEVRLPMQWSGRVRRATTFSSLQHLARGNASNQNVITHRDLGDYFLQLEAANIISPGPPPKTTDSIGLTPSRDTRRAPHPGSPAYVKAPDMRDVAGPSLDLILPSLISPSVMHVDSPVDSPGPKTGQECDPDNLPDNLPDGMVCQLTAEVEWRYVPGRVLNAKKGDLLLDPGGPGLVGQLLRQVTPPQFYSHCGIMSKDHIQIRHSTGSDDWLKDHLAGSVLGNKGTDGFDPQALKYLWPGTVTQSVDNAYYGEWLSSPDTGMYRIADFSFAPDLSDSSTIIYPIVVKPNPFDETATVRRTLHDIADAALAINGHYRLYCYTKPEIALGSDGVAGADAGWAVGTLATVCSSFIWLAAQHANVRLEGPNAITNVTDLEPTDLEGGARVSGSTLDGLYFYTAEERQAAVRWLHQTVHDIAYNKAGFWGTTFTDAPDNVANQMCNTFASDWADGSEESNDWKTTGSANAVSPDNLIFWDSPGSGNQGDFRSVYGYVEELFYLPGTYAQVPVYRWKLVATKGKLTGTITASGEVKGANVSLLGSGIQDVVVGADGRFEFDQVPAGDYTITAGRKIGGFWYANSVPAHILAGNTVNVHVPLLPPPEIDRLVTITVSMGTTWGSLFGGSGHVFEGSASVRVQPFSSHAHLDFGGGDTPRGQIGFDIDLNADLSITVSWTAQEVDDEVETQQSGGTSVPRDWWRHWSGLTVVNDDPIDNDDTTMSFTISNGQASA